MAACGLPADLEYGDAAARTITFLYKGDHRILGPAWDDWPKFLVFLPLVSYEEYFGGGPPQPAILESWEHSGDYRRWTVSVQLGLEWHDGEPVTAHDIKFTVDLWKHPSVLHYAGGLHGDVTVIDDLHCRFDFDKPSRDLLGGWNVIYPQHLLVDLDPGRFWEWEFWTRPVGNGPFRFTRYVPDTMIELEANPKHFRGGPQVDRVIIKLSGGSALAELLGGSVDLASVSAEEAARLRRERDFRVFPALVPHQVRLFWNLRLGKLADARVRQALTLGIDRRGLFEVMGMPEEMPLYDGLCTNGQWRRGDCGGTWPFDPEGARERLAAAGWEDSNRDGVVERNGERLELEMMVEPSHLAAAVFVQQQLRVIGVEVDVMTLDYSALRGRLLGKDFESAVFQLANTPSHHSEYFATFNPFGYTEGSVVGLENAELEELFARAVAAMDSQDVDAIYRRIGELFFRELPATYLFSRVDYVAAHRRIRGLESPYRAEPIGMMEFLSIEETPREGAESPRG